MTLYNFSGSLLRYLCWHLFASEKLFRIVAVSFAATSMLVAIKYFDPKPALSVEVRNLSDNEYIPFDYASFVDFYRSRGRSVPAQVLDALGGRSLVDRGNQVGHFEHEVVLRGILASDKHLSKFQIDWGVERLEGLLLKDGKPIISWTEAGEVDSLETLKARAEMVRKEVGKQEYYLFLRAMLNARFYDEWIVLVNDGELDLKDVVVHVTPAISEVEEDKRSSLFKWRHASPDTAHFIQGDEKGIMIRLPSLKRGKSFPLQVQSRSHPIDKGSIAVEDYKEERTIPSPGKCFSHFVIFALLSTFFFALADTLNPHVVRDGWV